MKPFLAIVDNIVKVFTLSFSERIDEYWEIKANELINSGIDQYIVDNAKIDFINSLYNHWFGGTTDPFIADLPEDLQTPEIVQFEFNYFEDSITVNQVGIGSMLFSTPQVVKQTLQVIRNEPEESITGWPEGDLQDLHDSPDADHYWDDNHSQHNE